MPSKDARPGASTVPDSASGTADEASPSGFDVDLSTTGVGRAQTAEPGRSDASSGARAVPEQPASADSGSGPRPDSGSGRHAAAVESFRLDAIPPERVGPLTGTLLENRYLIKEKLGEGGMGVVYRAEHTLMRKEMAVKVLLPQFGNLEGIKRRFHREAQSASRLDHPGIIHVNDFGETEDGILFIAMELLEGRSLTEVIRSEAPLPVSRAARIALQLCLALDHAHNEGVVHRDLKPDNVMIVQRGEAEDVVKVLDFGIAKITQADEASGEALTEAGMVFGTPEYLSPEQAAGQVADTRSDIYTLGVILYEMLAGVRPFTAPTKLELIGKHLNERPVPLRKRKPELDIPADLDKAVLKALEKHPEDRYQTAAEFFEALSGVEAVASEPLPLWPTNTLTFTAQTSVGTLPPRRSRRRALLLGAVGGALLALAVTVIALTYGGVGASGPAGNAPEEARASASKKRAPADQIRAVQTLLTAGNVKAAAAQLESLADQFPTDPRVHLLAGQSEFLRNHHGAALRAFREAVRLDPAMRRNELLLSRIYTYLTWKKGPDFGWALRREAMDFVDRYLDVGAAAMLTKYANTWWERPLVWRAISFLSKHNADKGVDYVHAYELVFRTERSCEKRKRHLQDVVKRHDPRFLPLLRTILKTSAWRGKYSRHWVRNGCIAAEVKAAITVLEGLESDARPRARQAGARTATARPR